MAVAARDVVLFEYQHPVSADRQIGGADQAAESGADDYGIPLVLVRHSGRPFLVVSLKSP